MIVQQSSAWFRPPLRLLLPVVALLLCGCAPIQSISVDTASEEAAASSSSAPLTPPSQEPKVIPVVPSSPAEGLDTAAPAASAPDMATDRTVQTTIFAPVTFALSDMLTLTTAYASAPVEIVFPALNLTIPVEPMTWGSARQNGVKTTYWILPENAAGWHPDSAGAGEEGNTILSGSQLTGAAVFAPLALGEIQPGQEIILRNGAGDSFAYTVTEVSEPLAIDDDPEAAAALPTYVQPALSTGIGRLTLLSGWPDFTTTHRIVVVAEQSGRLP